MSVTGFEWLSVLFPLITLLIVAVVFYFVIKAAVKNGIREVLREEGLHGRSEQR